MALKVSLELYKNDRADFEKVLAAIRTIEAASLEQLHDVAWLVEVIRSVGLYPMHPIDELFADEAHLANSSGQGLMQLPLEFAKFLRFMSAYQIESYLEIGTYNGGTACLATAYLHRFNPRLRAMSIDVWPWFVFYSEVRDLIPLDYRCGLTSFSLVGQQFDAVFIDGDHTFEWAWADYQNVGRGARVCGIHDVMSQFYLENEETGGVTTAWELIKQTEGGPDVHFEEYSHHPKGNLFGIGIRAQRE